MKIKHLEAIEKSDLVKGIIDWSFTFTIIHFKKVTHLTSRGDEYKAFSKFSVKEQKEILGMTLSKITNDMNIQMNIHYETHTNMNKKCYHAHGTIYKVSNESMKIIQRKICEAMLHLKDPSFWEYFFYVPTYFHMGWNEYCIKDAEKEAKKEENLKNLALSIEDEEINDSDLLDLHYENIRQQSKRKHFYASNDAKLTVDI